MGIRRVLVANRGEIARRVFRTCRDLGIGTVAVHSDADEGLPFVREADVAVRLPGSAPAETYLRADLLLDAARRTGADALHPGYGFLSESGDFARAVIDAGLTWVGPTPEAMRQMASKVEAKKLMEGASVPVLPEVDPTTAVEADLPLVVKASAGGAGRGMRVVRRLESLPSMVEGARAEAASAFGDGTVFIEPYVEGGRHVEVQVMGDRYGAVLVLGERDCSVQRRHQKVIEETPARGLSTQLRASLHDAARRAAEAVGYIGAGTVEFLLDQARGQYFFLEMNTRLQVEHPVTELVTGLDLVSLQIAVAEGRALADVLGDGGGVPAPRGHAVEVRLYAEDPAQDWQPQSGRLTRLEVPGVAAEFANPAAYGIRLDAGVVTGSEVGTHYDAMLAKVLAWAPTREEACRRLAATLSRSRLHGVHTNRDLLAETLVHSQFLAGDVSTAFLDEVRLSALDRPGVPGERADGAMVLFAAAVGAVEEAASRRVVQRGVPHGWRNVVSAPQTVTFEVAGTECRVGWLADSGGYAFVELDGEVDGGRTTSVERDDRGAWRVVVERDGASTAYDVFVDGPRVDVESPHGHVALTKKPRLTGPADEVATGSLLAPMPGLVIAVHCTVGDEVSAGQEVLAIEAMKMQHVVTAPYTGVVIDLPLSPGDQVSAGAVLVVLEQAEAITAEPTTERAGDHP